MTVSITLGGGQTFIGEMPLRLTQAEFQHEVIRVSVPSSILGLKRFVASGTPVHVEWGAQATTKGSFVGYVNHCEPIAPPAWEPEAPYIEVVAVGLTFPMKTTSYDSYKNITVPSLVSKVAGLFKLQADVQNHDFLWTFSQQGKGYWEFLVEMAKRIGYTLIPLAGVLTCHDRSIGVAKQQSLVRSLRFEQNLHTFKSSIGTSSPEGGELAERFVYGVDRRSQKRIFSKDAGTTKPTLGAQAHTPLFQRAHTTIVASSSAEAAARAKGEAANNRLYLAATAMANGNAKLHAGAVVDVSAVDGMNDGLWYVTQAVHEVKLDIYTTALTLGRDAVTGSATIKAAPPRTSPNRAPRLVNGRWVA